MNTNRLYAFLLKLFNTVKRNVFYILLSLLVPVILWKVQVGRDIIVNLAEQGQHNYLNIPLLIASFSLLALSNWVIPVLAIDIWKLVMRRRANSQALYGGLIGLYNGDSVAGKGQLPIRYFASLPWVIFLYVAVHSLVPDRPFIAFATLVALALSVFLLDWAYRGKRVPKLFQGLWNNVAETKAGNRAKALRYVVVMSMVFALFLIVVGTFGFWLRNDHGGLTALVIVANFIGLLANYAYMKFAENVDVRVVSLSYFVSKYIHILSLSFMVVVAVLLQTSNGRSWPIEIGSFSPIFILITAISLYLFLADVLVTTQLNITTIFNSDPVKYSRGHQPASGASVWYQPLIRLIALGFVFVFFFNSINSHRIRKTAVPHRHSYTATERPALTAYFDQWAASRMVSPGDTLDVYLVSGQGGGSRAAVWFFMAMNYLDSLKSTPSTRFSDRVFSISTVSGSTSGAAMYLADRYLGVTQQAPSMATRMKAIYARNYLSSSFWGLLVGDGYEGFKHEALGNLIGKRTAFPKDRNYYFQQEEIQGYQNATPTVAANKINAFFNGDYLAPYAAEDPAVLSTKLPLFFINSAVVETGERGVFSPVDLTSFSLGTDLYGLFRQHNPNHDIPFVACVTQSQAFPVINAYNYLEGAGRLIDGGIYENSGTATTLEIYEALRRHVAARRDNAGAIRFICINIVNTNMEAAKDAVRFRPASVLNTLTAAFQSPFGGHEQFSYRNILRRVSPPDTAFSFPLDRPVPLTRMLQPAAIDTMYAALPGMAMLTPSKGHGNKLTAKPNP